MMTFCGTSLYFGTMRLLRESFWRTSPHAVGGVSACSFRAYRRPHARPVTRPPFFLLVVDIRYRDWVRIRFDEFAYRLPAKAIGGAMPTGAGLALDDLLVQLLGRG
jgi:hypothetical protein